MIMTSAMIGTLKNIPTIPQIVPQKASERMMANGLMFSVFPINIGSSTLPIARLIAVRPNTTMTKGPSVSN